MLGLEPDEISDEIKIDAGPRVICEVETGMTTYGTESLNRFM